MKNIHKHFFTVFLSNPSSSKRPGAHSVRFFFLDQLLKYRVVFQSEGGLSSQILQYRPPTPISTHPVLVTQRLQP